MAFHAYPGNVLKFTRDEIKSGKTKEEILKATEIPGLAQWKGDGIQWPLGAAYDELMLHNLFAIGSLIKIFF